MLAFYKIQYGRHLPLELLGEVVAIACENFVMVG